MTLRFKRNLPLVITLISVLTVLVLIIGNQPIVSYTVNPNIVHTSSLTNMTNTIGRFSSLLSSIQP